MKINENTAISTADVLLVPYDSRHVSTYHTWMEDEAVRAATASERLTLQEEYANQISWRAAADKLTFIVCQPLLDEDAKRDARKPIVAGVDDTPDRMVGDINFFLYPWEADGEAEEEDENKGADKATTAARQQDGIALLYSGEVDVMIARHENRGRGLGRAAVTAFLYYILQQHQTAILDEATAGSAACVTARDGDGSVKARPPQLRQLIVKIQATNTASRNLFTSLGFQQNGGVNYFGEVELVCTNLDVPAPAAYSERVYVQNDA
ncbi:DNA polymerase subunit delta-2 [Niveomyces insectorum RCEF 264]|uniref:DNA polymerase subunit delta-2 n=1 Tax=Niveomyces insectorum RCEF 264 TaxID=1081102 RepID=A0A162IA74_9HYPO|nr:DNA polymerase subunit delta-2 [Niveomyces insectorum RCEF 264]